MVRGTAGRSRDLWADRGGVQKGARKASFIAFSVSFTTASMSGNWTLLLGPARVNGSTFINVSSSLSLPDFSGCDHVC